MNTLIEMATSFYGRPTPGAPDAAQEHAHAAASHEYARRLELRTASPAITAARPAQGRRHRTFSSFYTEAIDGINLEHAGALVR
jgi:hypothetical protein